MLTVERETGIPPPSRRGLTGDLRELPVGDSLFVEGKLPTDVTSQVSLARRGAPTKKFTCRQVVKDGRHGTRIWRIA